MQTKLRDQALRSETGFSLVIRRDSSTFDPLADVDSPSLHDVVSVARGDVWEIVYSCDSEREEVVGAGLIGFGYAMSIAAQSLSAIAARSSRPSDLS